MDLKETLSFAENLATKVGKLISDKQNEINIVSYKDLQDIVTNIDLEAEKLITSEIRKNYPTHSIFSEEMGHDSKKSTFEWIVDPLDGTKEYLRGIPQYNTSFALEKNKKAVLSVVYRPTNKQLYSAAEGLGSFLNRKKIKLSTQSDISKSYAFTYLPTYRQQLKESKYAWNKLFKLSRKVYRLRGVAEEASALSWVASGKIEAFVNINSTPKWHDVIPGLFIAQESGAKITDIKDNKIKNKDTSKGLIVSNGKIHDQLVQILS